MFYHTISTTSDYSVFFSTWLIVKCGADVHRFKRVKCREIKRRIKYSWVGSRSQVIVDDNIVMYRWLHFCIAYFSFAQAGTCLRLLHRIIDFSLPRSFAPESESSRCAIFAPWNFRPLELSLLLILSLELSLPPMNTARSKSCNKCVDLHVQTCPCHHKIRRSS